MARLQAQTVHCAFGDDDAVADQVCDQLVARMADNALGRKLLEKADLTLKDALKISREYGMRGDRGAHAWYG